MTVDAACESSIKNQEGTILFKCKASSTRECLILAVKAAAYLSGADLSRAYLSGADLSGANLSGANLSRADLSGANLSRAYLSRADLSRANLSGANLSRAYLSRAYLSRANLSGANLSRAYLSRAYLSGANLSRADLSRANLTGADLSGANLTGANLTGADLSGADLDYFRQDFIAEVLKLPDELEFLRDALLSGRIDGSTYTGECACLAGTLAKAKNLEAFDGSANIQSNGCTFRVSSTSPREQWFMAIRPGHTPENNAMSKAALEWTQEAIAIRDHIRRAVPSAREAPQ